MSLMRLITSFAWLAAGLSAQLAPWPAGPGTEIGHEGAPGGLPAGFETSGVQWHPGRGTVVVVGDGGFVAELSPTGGPVTLWSLPGDLEAVALANPASSLVYVGVEQPDGVIEFDLSTGLATGNHWDLTPWMTGPANQGLEALACVEGVFYAGLQVDGRIFRFVLGPGGAVQFLGSFASHLGRTDIAGLDYDACTGVLYAIHDTANVIVEYLPDGTFIREYALAGSDQEGIALVGGTSTSATRIFIAQDTGELVRYESYPVAICPAGTWTDLGSELAGISGVPSLTGTGPLVAASATNLALSNARPSAPAVLFVGLGNNPTPFKGGSLVPVPWVLLQAMTSSASGTVALPFAWPANLPSAFSLHYQFGIKDAAAVQGVALSNALQSTTP